MYSIHLLKPFKINVTRTWFMFFNQDVHKRFLDARICHNRRPPEHYFSAYNPNKRLVQINWLSTNFQWHLTRQIHLQWSFTNSSQITNCSEDPTHYCYPYSWWAGLKTKPELWLTRTGREEAGEGRRAARTTVLIGLYSNSVTGVVWEKKNSARVGKRTHRAVCQE